MILTVGTFMYFPFLCEKIWATLFGQLFYGNYGKSKFNRSLSFYLF